MGQCTFTLQWWLNLLCSCLAHTKYLENGICDNSWIYKKCLPKTFVETVYFSIENKLWSTKSVLITNQPLNIYIEFLKNNWLAVFRELLSIYFHWNLFHQGRDCLPSIWNSAQYMVSVLIWAKAYILFGSDILGKQEWREKGRNEGGRANIGGCL